MWQHRFHTGHVLGVAALLAPSMGVFAPNLVSPLAICTMVGLLVLRNANRENGIRSDPILFTIIASILGWSMVSLFWTINFSEALWKWAAIAGFALLATAALILAAPMAEHERHTLRRFVLSGIALGFVSFFVEMASDGAIVQNGFGKVPISGYVLGLFNLTPSFLFLFIWPAVGILWRTSPYLGLALLGLGAAAAVILPSASAAIGFISGVVFFFSSLLAPRGANLFVAATIAIGIVIAPFVPRIAPALAPAEIRSNSSSPNSSLLHRLDIWSFTIERIEERPLIGWGFNASRAVPDGGARYYVRDRSGQVVGQGDRLPLHPHNGALQIWLELGLPGAIAFAALFALVALRCNRQTDSPGMAAALAALATAGPIWLLSFGVWQTWWLSVLFLSALFTVSLIAPERL